MQSQARKTVLLFVSTHVERYPSRLGLMVFLPNHQRLGTPIVSQHTRRGQLEFLLDRRHCMHPRPSPMHLSSLPLVRFGENFGGVILQYRFLLPAASCVFALRLGIPTHGTSSGIAHECTTPEIEHADQTAFVDPVFVSSQRDAN